MTIPCLFPLLNAVRKYSGYQIPRLGPFYRVVRAQAPAILDVELFSGVRVRLDLTDEVQFQTYWYGTRFEEPTGAILRGWWEAATHFFDIGSNYGFFSLWAASLGGSLKIHAFEPNPVTFAKLDGFARANGFDSIIRNAIALSDTEKSFTLQLEEENSGASHMIDPASQSSKLSVAHVRALPFDEYAAALDLKPSGSVAKIDVEGMELHVLRGMPQALTRKVFRGICVELLEENLQRAGTSVAEVDTLLRKYGYSPSFQAASGTAGTSPNHHNAFYVPA